MDKRIIMAVAGSGKTYQIANKIDAQKRNLILAFTHRNIENLKREIEKRFKIIPDKTIVMTFDSFKYNDLYLPVNTNLFDKLINKDFPHKGITLREAPQQRINNRPNPFYVKNDNKHHYVCELTSEVYLGRISSLLVYKSNRHLLNQSIDRIDFFFDNIFIDEFQDFRKKDFDLLMRLVKRSNSKILLYGDYYQHSVSGMNNSGKPFNKNYEDFITFISKNNLVVNDTNLIKSRRCPEDICKIIRDKLDIKIYSEGINSGRIIELENNKDILKIINDDNIKKLVYKNSKNYTFNCINWGYSKGDTYSNTCIILTGPYENIMDPKFVKPKSQKSINDFYVALTRSKGNVYLIKPNDFKKVSKLFVNQI